MSGDEILYQLFDLKKDNEFKKLITDLNKDELFCDTCYRPNFNSSTLLKYNFFQNINNLETIQITLQNELLNFTFNTISNNSINVNITYPITKTITISLCDYYRIFFCNPALFCCLDSLIIIEFKANSNIYKVKGNICNFIVQDISPSISKYCIKILNCNCFTQELLTFSQTKSFESINIKIYPPNSFNSNGQFISNIVC